MESVGNCYQVTCSDILGVDGQKDENPTTPDPTTNFANQAVRKPTPDNTIECMFHSDCKEIIQSQVRRGKILLLEKVAVFSLGVVASKSNLVVMQKCIKKVIK